jgi:hypothetical protein
VDKFPIQNGLKQGDAQSPMLFNFVLEYAVRNVLDNQGRVGVEWDTSSVRMMVIYGR